jgi:hypothetical protein
MRRKIRTLHKQIGEVPFLFFCLALWAALFSLVLLISGNASVLPGFLLGTAGSAFYAWLLYRRVPVLLSLPFSLKTVSPPKDRDIGPPPDRVKYPWSVWLKIMLPVVSIVLIILAFSSFFQNISFLAALFGFFSFQISLFVYAILISAYPSV